MNFSAINAAALNGSAEQIWNGSGNAVIALVMVGRGVGTVARSASLIQVVATGNAKKAARGNAGSNISLNSAGAGTRATLAGAHANVALNSSGSSANVSLARGDAEIALNTAGHVAMVVLSHADALIAFGGAYGIPSTLPAPATFMAAPDARRISGGEDIRIVKVPAEQALQVRNGRRAANIQREGRQA